MSCLVSILLLALSASPQQVKVNRLLTAMEKVESGGRTAAVGDKGASRGILQIKAPYWREACQTGGAKWAYSKRVWNRADSRQVAQWYWKRYCPDALRNGRVEVLARVHNGGPYGYRKSSTDEYWGKVSRVYKETK